MPDIFFCQSLANLAMCLTVAIPLVWGFQRLRVLKDVEPSSSDGLPQLSAIVAARDEERDIEIALDSLLAQDYPHLEIIVDLGIVPTHAARLTSGSALLT